MNTVGLNLLIPDKPDDERDALAVVFSRGGVGLVAERGWAVIEFNAAWGAGLNGYDPELSLPVIVMASTSLNRI